MISKQYIEEHITQEDSKIKAYRENNKFIYMYAATMKSKKYVETNGLTVEEDYIGFNTNPKKRRIMAHPSESYAESILKGKPGIVVIVKLYTNMLEHITPDIYLYSQDIQSSDIIGPNSKKIFRNKNGSKLLKKVIMNETNY